MVCSKKTPTEPKQRGHGAYLVVFMVTVVLFLVTADGTHYASSAVFQGAGSVKTVVGCLFHT